MDFLTEPLFLTSLTVALPSTSEVNGECHRFLYRDDNKF